ncbi:MAG: DinB family protein [Fuerstiella sp.]
MSDISTILAEYAAGPELLAASVAGLSDADYDATPIPDRWSIRQVVCHVVDFEIVYADRMKRVLAEENPTMFGGDPDCFAGALHYLQRSIPEELALMSAIRKSTARILSQCDLEDFQRTGVHSEDGPITLETLLENICAHVPHHVKFVNEKRQALGRT